MKCDIKKLDYTKNLTNSIKKKKKKNIKINNLFITIKGFQNEKISLKK